MTCPWRLVVLLSDVLGVGVAVSAYDNIHSTPGQMVRSMLVADDDLPTLSRLALIARADADPATFTYTHPEGAVYSFVRRG